MKTLIEITTDYNSTDSYDYRNEQISEILRENNVYCEVKNNRFTNPVKSTGEKTDYKNKIIIDAIGYSQSDWQAYVLRYNKMNDSIKYLIQLLERSFTHQNDYFVQKFEVTNIKGKQFKSEAIDITTFGISDIEFPDENEVLKAYNDIYGKDYDIFEINID